MAWTSNKATFTCSALPENAIQVIWQTEKKKLYPLINILHNMFIQINCPVWKTFRLLTKIEFDIQWKYEKGGCHQHTALV